MASIIEYVEFNCTFEYKQLKLIEKEWLSSSLLYSSINNTTWCLQVDRLHPTKLGIYLTLIDGAPCTLCSYTLSMITNKEPSLLIFVNKCTQKRTFPSNSFSWGFANFCSRRELKDERNLICNPKTKLVNLRCSMNIEILIPNNITDDHRLATDLYSRCSLEQWIEFLKQSNHDLPELTNRVNEEIAAKLS
ncbi:unnamed protein product [Rotaria magnacalcarata]|uniref:Uncharacterized protein n=2 Tax=Rotaria magnacalcarata TaxID=392030 RepID=A0A814F762_9BILA|nr:unnamed protein product [Rotaria magnacalcarata]CAF1665927.1 unnamed protein product [Rotaria magnacalcarata]CAF2048273.1 unnamed protein product [Rotaria magnacalcarata]CAF2062870.1 unnamed protein product [Rotaria magnacalcarata]CAF2078912.1 unnamed protein product [Rotaria magnacalcarata]